MALRVGLLVVGIAVTGCATTGPPRGVAGPVEWEVTDVGWLESRDGMRSRWSFTIVLREKAGIAIQFERIDRSARGEHRNGDDLKHELRSSARSQLGVAVPRRGELGLDARLTAGVRRGRAPGQPDGRETVRREGSGRATRRRTDHGGRRPELWTAVTPAALARAAASADEVASGRGPQEPGRSLARILLDGTVPPSGRSADPRERSRRVRRERSGHGPSAVPSVSGMDGWGGTPGGIRRSSCFTRPVGGDSSSESSDCRPRPGRCDSNG